MIDTPQLNLSNEQLAYENQSNVKALSFCFVHYGNPTLILDNVPNIRHVFSILHDKDTKEGTLNEKVIPHYHTIITFQNPRHLSSMRRVAANLKKEYGQSFLVEPCHSLSRATEYVLHRSTECLENPNKHQYTYNDAMCDNDAFWRKIAENSDDAYNGEFVRDVLTLPPIKMAYKYGKDYIRHHKSYNEFRSFILGIYEGHLEEIMADVNFEGDKKNFKELLNRYFIERKDID